MDKIFTKGIFQFAVAITVLFIIMLFLNYIFQSLAIYRMMKSRKIKGAFLSWIPVTFFYALGSVCDDIKRKNDEKTKFRFALSSIYLLFLLLRNSVIITLISKLSHTIQYNLNSEVLSIMRDYISNSSVNFLPGLLLSTHTVLCFVCLYTIYRTYAPNCPSYFAAALVFTLIPIIPFIPGIYLWKASKNIPIYRKKMIVA